MENFTNETIDTKQLPRFEEVKLTLLHPKYLNVVVLNSILIVIILVVSIFLFIFFDEEVISKYGINRLAIATIIISFFILLIPILKFKKKAYAFRNHDVIFRSGIISTNTMVVPYNRVQHVALHEGFISRFFRLATVEIFTAGGSSSDVEIPGIAKEEAEKIKQLLMGKIQKQL